MFFKRWAAAFLLKLKIFLITRMSSGSELYSFSSRKAKERWPVYTKTKASSQGEGAHPLHPPLLSHRLVCSRVATPALPVQFNPWEAWSASIAADKHASLGAECFLEYWMRVLCLLCWSLLFCMWWLLKEPFCLLKNLCTSLLNRFLGGRFLGGLLCRGFLSRKFLGGLFNGGILCCWFLSCGFLCCWLFRRWFLRSLLCRWFLRCLLSGRLLRFGGRLLLWFLLLPFLLGQLERARSTNSLGVNKPSSSASQPHRSCSWLWCIRWLGGKNRFAPSALKWQPWSYPNKVDDQLAF